MGLGAESSFTKRAHGQCAFREAGCICWGALCVGTKVLYRIRDRSDVEHVLAAQFDLPRTAVPVGNELANVFNDGRSLIGMESLSMVELTKWFSSSDNLGSPKFDS